MISAFADFASTCDFREFQVGIDGGAYSDRWFRWKALNVPRWKSNWAFVFSIHKITWNLHFIANTASHLKPISVSGDTNHSSKRTRRRRRRRQKMLIEMRHIHFPLINATVSFVRHPNGFRRTDEFEPNVVFICFEKGECEERISYGVYAVRRGRNLKCNYDAIWLERSAFKYRNSDSKYAICAQITLNESSKMQLYNIQCIRTNRRTGQREWRLPGRLTLVCIHGAFHLCLEYKKKFEIYSATSFFFLCFRYFQEIINICLRLYSWLMQNKQRTLINKTNSSRIVSLYVSRLRYARWLDFFSSRNTHIASKIERITKRDTKKEANPNMCGWHK